MDERSRYKRNFFGSRVLIHTIILFMSMGLHCARCARCELRYYAKCFLLNFHRPELVFIDDKLVTFL